MIDSVVVHVEAWKEKTLHGQFCHQVLPHVDHRWQWSWLRSVNLLKETEGFFMITREHALMTNVIKSQIRISPPCFLLMFFCRSEDKTIDHLISSCTFLVQSHFKKRHDTVASYIHWKLSSNASFDVVKNWWQHHPDI